MTCADAQATWGLVLTQPKREVLRAYLDCADADGMSCPGVKRIAWMTDYSTRQAQRITHALVQDGLLLPTVRDGKATEYRFDFSKAAKKPDYSEERENVTPDIAMSPPSMSPLTLDVTPQHVTPDITMSPLTSAHVHASAPGKDKNLKDLNTQEQKQELKDKSGGGVGVNADERAKIFSQYEQLTGHFVESRLVMEQLLDDAKAYPEWWIDEAVSGAALNGSKTWNYVRKTLQAWHRDGKERVQSASVSYKPPPRAAPTTNGKHPPSLGNDGILGLKAARQGEK